MKILVKTFCFMLLICILGCGSVTVTNENGEVVKPDHFYEEEIPPKYNYGDTVIPITDKERRICVIVERSTYDHKWRYRVMHQDMHFNYYQEDLQLLSSFDWNIPIDKAIDILDSDVKAEIETIDEILEVQ